MDTENAKKMTILMLSDDYRKAVTAFRLAIIGTSKGMEATIFFTSCGLKAVKKNQKLKLPGLLRPFTWIVAKRMEEAGMGRLDDLIRSALQSKVGLYACKSCASVLRIRGERFIEGVEVVGTNRYIELVMESDVHLVIS